MTETMPWWVTSDPDHPANPDREVVAEPDPVDLGPDPQQVAAEALARSQADQPEVPAHIADAVEQASYVPSEIAEAARIADSPDATPAERQEAVDKLMAWRRASAETQGTETSSGVPTDLIPAQFQAKRAGGA